MVLKDSSHSYERFATNPVIQRIDRALAERAPHAHNVVDFATGTGVMIQHLLRLGRLQQPYRVKGVDVDSTGLSIAREKFKGIDNISFVQAPVDARIPGIDDASANLVLFANAIHLTNVPGAFAEAHRVLREGGTLLISSAYASDIAYPSGTARLWGKLIADARKSLKTDYPIIQKPENFMSYASADFQSFAKAAGFTDVTISTHEVQMDLSAMLAICDYEGFVTGSLPGIPVEAASRALKSAARDLFEHHVVPNSIGRKIIPRTWMFLEAKKAETVPASLRRGRERS